MSTQLAEQEQQAAESEVASAIEQQVKMAMAAGREAWWDLSESLHAFDEARGWLKLGYDTLEEWLAQPDIGMRRTTYFRAVGAWRKLVVERQIDAGRLRLLDGSKVDVVVPAITAGTVPVDEALDDAGALAKRDLREKYRREPTQGESHRRDTDEPAPTRDDAGDSATANVGGQGEPGDPAKTPQGPYGRKPDDDPDAEPMAGDPSEPTAEELAEVESAVEVVQREIENALSSGAPFPRVSVAALRVCAELLREALARDPDVEYTEAIMQREAA